MTKKGNGRVGLDVWFREDVARILASTQETMAATRGGAPALDPDRADAYQQGFTDALRVVAVAFGLVAPGLSGGEAPRRPASRARSGGCGRLPGWE
ncbi:MAG: hypothetical protein JXA93_07755 [Anaerolineae bacterium]|nr:hypothetical protein [Anaerolineae bacterium]